MRTALFALCLTLAAGCGDKEEPSDSGTSGADGTAADGADGGGDGTDGTSDGADGTASEAPLVESGRVVCVPPTSGPEAIVVEVQANDPQGADTLGASFFACDGVFDDVALVCSPTGACTASIRSEDYGVSCAEGDGYTWQVNLVDEDGNESGWQTLEWDG